MKTKPRKSEMEDARNLVGGAVEKASEVLGVETDPEFALGFTFHPFTESELGGVSGQTFGEGSRIDLHFNSGVENWKHNLKRTAAHEYAHTQFLKKHPRSGDEKLWKVILGEAQATNLADKCFSGFRPGWMIEMSREELERFWPEAKKILDEDMGWENRVFHADFYNSKFPSFFGYLIAFRIGEKLMEKYDLEDFPELGKEDVVEAGDRLLGGEG